MKANSYPFEAFTIVADNYFLFLPVRDG